MSETDSTANPAETTAPAAQPHRRCRSLRVNGVQCKDRALCGEKRCFSHANYSHPTCPSGGNIVIPLLEDDSAIRLLATQVAQGLLAETLDPERAGKILYACQVAAMTLPRPTRGKAAETPEPVQEPVVEVAADPDGQPLGPDEPYRGPRGAFEPIWSISKYMYEQECERLGKPKPTCAADFPASGWLTEEEIKEDPEEFGHRYSERIRQAREHNAAVRAQEEEAAGIREIDLSELPPSTCWCGGLQRGNPCWDCRRAAEELRRTKAGQGDAGEERGEGEGAKGRDEQSELRDGPGLDLHAVAAAPSAVRAATGERLRAREICETTRNQQPQILRSVWPNFRPNAFRMTGVGRKRSSGTGG